MGRETFFRLSWSRFAQASAAALITVVLAGSANGDTIKNFVVSGTAQNGSGKMLGACAVGATCSFFGTMMVDVTSGTVTAEDITFPGLPSYHILFFSGPAGAGWHTVALSNAGGPGGNLNLSFTTTTPASLVGFDGGSITVSSVARGTHFFYFNLTGRITPVPEPSSLVLLGSGLIGLVGMARHKLKR